MRGYGLQIRIIPKIRLACALSLPERKEFHCHL
jgi:hypothetical protein